MKQPDLGKKIAELRQAKGLTQSELAEKCNLSTRTIQRIESAEVSPRSYTVKMIFACLEYDIYNSFGKFTYWLDRSAYRIQTWLGQFYKYVLELFNLKTNTMKKIMILSIPVLSLLAVLLLTGLDGKAQDKQKVQTTLNCANANFMKWFNAGQIDSIGSLYMDNACTIPDNYREIHGWESIKGYYYYLYNLGFRFTENKSASVIITDSILVDRGIWKANIQIEPNSIMTGTYLAQWRLVDGKWYIENEMTNSDMMGNEGFGK